MNHAVSTLRAAASGAIHDGAKAIGYVVNYDADGISILRTDLKALFEGQGFAGFVPETMDPVAALARAKGRPLPKGIKVDVFVRPNDDATVSYGVYRKHAVDGERGDTFECGARVRLDKATGEIVALPPDGADASADCLKVAEEIAAAANKLVKFAETLDVTTAAKNVVLGSLHGMAMKSKGGLYFVRPAQGEQWRALAAELERFGFLDLGFPMTAGAAAQKAAAHAVKTGLESKLAELRDRIASFDVKTRESNVQDKVERLEALVSETELYADILGGWRDGILAQVAEAKAKCVRKLAGDDDVDFSFDGGAAAPEAPPAPPAPPPPPAPAAGASAHTFADAAPPAAALKDLFSRGNVFAFE